MGTPNFAIPALKAILQSGEHELLAVYTKEPKASGRDMRINKTPVHILAQSSNVPIFTPKNFKNTDDIEALRSLKPDVCIVAAYGLILPQSVLNIPKYGCINIHPSSLPRWRGAAPIQHTILSADKSSSVCIMQMDIGMDTGDILMQEHFDIPMNMTASQLHDFTADLGANLLIKTLNNLENLKPTKQSEFGITYANKISRDHELINFNQEAHLVHAQIRAFSPKPGAYFRFNGENIKIISSDFDESVDTSKFSTSEVIDSNLTIACKKGVLKPLLLQREGRKMIYTDAFLRGYPITAGTLLA